MKLLAPYLLFVMTLAAPLLGAAEKTPADWADPQIDTLNPRWFYFTSASRPFGMVNLSPDTKTEGSWNSGYHYNDNHIRCFSHIHAWQLSGIAVMPTTGTIKGHLGMDAYQSEFSHSDEVAKIGYHKVVLKDYGITAELTATKRVGFHRYTYPKGKESNILFDTGALLAHSKTVSSMVNKVSDTEIVGWSLMGKTLRRPKDTYVYFVAQFNRPISDFGTWKKKQLIEDSAVVEGKDAGAWVRFSTKDEEPILMKVGISYCNVDQARKNISAELPGWDFDRAIQDAYDEWNSKLSRIQVEGGTDIQKTKFYTDLMHALKGRRTISDVDGRYCDMTGEKPVIRQVPQDNSQPKFAMYNYDGWYGSHWNINTLWPLLCPEVMSDFCNASVEMYKNGGLIPSGPSGGNYTFVMIGDQAAPFITAAYSKGIRDFDVEKAYEGLRKNAFPGGRRDYGGYSHNKSNPGVTQYYIDHGYVPIEMPLTGYHANAVTSLTLFSAFQDWCIGQMASDLGYKADADMFLKRGQNYRNVFNQTYNSMWVRTKDGGWLDDYKPIAKTFEQRGFCEGNANIYTYWVPQDPMGLAELFGGTDKLAEQLDSVLEKAKAHKFIVDHRKHASAWADYENQDSCGMAHLFNRIGYPWLAQKWVRDVYENVFMDASHFGGYHGDEDQGQMGSLSALMAMGLFQFDGGSSIDSKYDITAPVFERITITLSDKYYGGKKFTIVAKNQAPNNMYIQSVTWNGRPWNSSFLPHKELIKGGALELVLGDRPNKDWGLEKDSDLSRDRVGITDNK